MENEVELHQRNKLLKEMKHEKMQLLQKEKQVLEDLQDSVFQEKRQFCNDVNEFVESCGLPEMMLDVEQSTSESQTKGNYEQLKKELEEVKREHASTEEKLKKVKLHFKACQENQELVSENQEIKRNVIIINEINRQTELLEAECLLLEKEVNHKQNDKEKEVMP
ncbi:hypothetical protein C0J52_02522 [Blattella germanica]|nr:hypothetical protein C0J52_02522 [Blattella germanica]